MNKQQPSAVVVGREVVDPVCGMTIDPAKAAGRADYGGRTYYFCSRSCLERFQANPKRYADTARPPSELGAAHPGVDYVCPMDPEVRQKGPGPARSAAWRSNPISASRLHC